MSGYKNVARPKLIEPQKIVITALHIKLGLMKNFVKRLNKEGEDFKYLYRTFPRLSTAKLKEGIFIGPQIREELMKNTDFDNCLNFHKKLLGSLSKMLLNTFWVT